MSTVGEKEKRTQERVIAFFEDTLGYTYLGNWQNLQDNSNIDKSRLTDWLRNPGPDENIISKTPRELERAALSDSKTLYSANRTVYGLVRYSGNVQHPPGGRVRVSVPLRLDADAVRMAIISRLGWIWIVLCPQWRTYRDEFNRAPLAHEIGGLNDTNGFGQLLRATTPRNRVLLFRLPLFFFFFLSLVKEWAQQINRNWENDGGVFLRADFYQSLKESELHCGWGFT